MKIKKTDLAKSLNIHRHTVTNLIKAGKLASLELDDVVKYVYELGKMAKNRD